MQRATGAIRGYVMFRRVPLFCSVLLWSYSASLIAEPLQEGVWKGTYSVSQFQAQYHVTNTTEDDQVKPHIKMILPELEPRLDFTYELKDVLISDTGLSFTIQKKNEIQKCVLKKGETSRYTGTCLSDADKDGTMPVDISMIPPTVDTNESNASSADKENQQDK
jgi:hypothetical protein